MDIGMQITGLKELDAAMQGLEKRLATRIARRAVAKGAALIRNEAKQRARAQGLLSSGALVANIATKRETRTARTRTEYHIGVRHGAKAKNSRKLQIVRAGGKIRTIYQNDPFYWLYWEFGHQNILTRKREARPFLRPAWEAKRAAAEQLIRDTLAAEILKVR